MAAGASVHALGFSTSVLVGSKCEFGLTGEERLPRNVVFQAVGCAEYRRVILRTDTQLIQEVVIRRRAFEAAPRSDSAARRRRSSRASATAAPFRQRHRRRIPIFGVV